MPFQLIDRHAGNTESISAQSVVSKLSLLTLHFPNLQLIWSRSPTHTAEIFLELKRSAAGGSNCLSAKDPDPLKIAKIGKVGNVKVVGEGVEASDSDEENYNRLMPREFLKRIPGIHSNNIQRVMSKVRNMVEFVQLSLDQMEVVIGNREGARKAFEFVNYGSRKPPSELDKIAAATPQMTA